MRRLIIVAALFLSTTALAQYSPAPGDSVLTYNMFVNTGRIRINTQFFNVFDSIDVVQRRIDSLFSRAITITTNSLSTALSVNQNGLGKAFDVSIAGSSVFNIDNGGTTTAENLITNTARMSSLYLPPVPLYPKLASISLGGLVSPIALGDLLVAGTGISLSVNISSGAVTITNTGGGGGGIVPTGTGFYHITGGSADAAARAVNLASTDITNVLPIANGGTNSSTTLLSNRIMISLSGAIKEAPSITANRVIVSDASGLPVSSATSSTTLGFLDISSSLTTLLSNKQPLNTDLSSIAALATTGIPARTASGIWQLRTISGDGEIVVASGNGVGGNPLLSIGSGISRRSDFADSAMKVIGATYDVPHIGSGDTLIYGHLRDSTTKVIVSQGEFEIQKADTVMRLGTRANNSEQVSLTVDEIDGNNTQLNVGSQISNSFTFNVNGSFTVNGSPVTGSGGYDGQDADSIQGKPISTSGKYLTGNIVQALVWIPDSNKYAYRLVFKVDTLANGISPGQTTKLYIDHDGIIKIGNDSTSSLSLPVIYPEIQITAGYFINAAGDLTGASAVAVESDNTNDWSARYMQFDADVKNYASALFQMPPDWDGTTAPKFKVISYSDASNALTVARWGIAAAYTTTGSWQAALGTEVYATQTYTATYTLQGTILAPTPSGSAAAGAFMRIRVMRDADNALDTFTGKSRLVEVVMQYKKTSYGSTSSW